MSKKKIKINYLDRDFNSIKASLIDYAKRYYSDTYKDFNEASFGSLMLDLTAYVGDVLSFYLDYSANESFLDTAIEYNNIIRLGRPMGFRFKGRPTSYGKASFYIKVPANTVGLGPNSNYIPILKKGSEFTTTAGTNFILNENVDFSNENNEITVADVNDSNGLPTYYAIKAQGEVISGEFNTETISVGPFEKFRKIKLTGQNIAEIISVFDSEGHEYFEVDFLSNDVVYRPVINRNSDKDRVPNILKPIMVPRRFVSIQERNRTYIQFGYGDDEEIKNNSIADPSSVILKRYGKDYDTNDSFDPSNLMETDKFGVGPSNTSLTVITRNNTSENVNVSVHSLSSVTSPGFEFRNIANLNAGLVSTVSNSLEVDNEEPIVGDVTFPTSEELKIRIQNSFATQNRAVTEQDYISAIYRMPTKYGSIKRARVIQDTNSFKRNLNVYVLCEDSNGILSTATSTVKNNLKTWLASQKMINDTLDILDSYVINVGIEFDIIIEEDQNKYDILERAIQTLSEEYEIKMDIGEPFNISRIYGILNDVPGVLDTTNVKIINKVGGSYSNVSYNIKLNTVQGGRMIICPENACFEVRYSKIDIVGNIK